MVGEEAALEIRVLHRHGKGIREIAHATGLSRNTVRRYRVILIPSKPRPTEAIVREATASLRTPGRRGGSLGHRA